MKQHCVIFDMDGVICHTNPHHAKAFEAFFDKYQIRHSEQEFEEHMYGKHNGYIMTHFFKRPITGEELIKLEDEKEGMFREVYKDKVETIPFYLDFLSELRSRGFKTAVATSAPRANLDLIANVLKLDEKMDSMMSSEDVKQHKPNPEVYLKSAERVGVSPSDCVVFEDSFSGVTAGLNAGMKVVGVLSSHTKEQLPPCDFYINDYSEVDVDKVLELLNK
ncbi:haloacid dehalogenase superfamily, subfamily IA, variant 3 with third motif having DD or ED [Flavobacterium aquidurense]|uniref:Haloacid dehalogenase n=1 Tax=Flavobacterium frigidimaris TaxID=262320 RepID=A0ABX4BJQ7_FLAFR|nr:HAD family phosphatase [Flavobacterium frigidimaris]OXA74901.1 haloacid dehalogenase [Flavobacterium frigidimaris]SDZ37996.1 haloacid dehalogenase superfamily, subfamily IA, variant 3 with third motif having DD or ED [Flavobacterium aquidurense]